MLNEPDKIEQGKLKLQGYSHPPLVAGDYELNTTLSIEGKGLFQQVPTGTTFQNNSLTFSVAAPRFSLDASLIYSRYPLPVSKGAYHTSLPNIIFTRKTLPWERSVHTQGTAGNTPWFALILLSVDEIKGNNVIINELLPIEDVANNKSNTNLLVPNIALDDWELDGSKIKVIEMPLSLFTSIAPTYNEMELLVHTIQIDTSNKENTNQNPKGIFSAVGGNRLPQQAAMNAVILVSLEGQDDNLKVTDTAKSIRLVILNQWMFEEAGATFEELIEELEANTLPFRVEQDELTNIRLQNDTAKGVARALEFGYVPLNHNRREGTKVVS
jgi:flagellar motor protein MotB